MVGDGENVVAQLVIREAVFWVATAGASSERLVPREVGGSTGRLLLVVDDPAAVQARAVVAGATEKSPVDQEHGWLVGRVVDPYVMNGRSVSHLPIGLPRSRSKGLGPIARSCRLSGRPLMPMSGWHSGCACASRSRFDAQGGLWK